ncbi:MAG: phytanoyl-CoA dioxygenase family protein [Alphaproteobacteria bacterium]
MSDAAPAFDAQGFVAPIPAISAAEAAAIHAGLERVRPADPQRAASAFGTNCHLLHPDLYDLALDDRVLDAVEPILGPDILAWSAALFAKAPHTGKYVSWHQDSTYWGLEPPDIVTAWIALTPSTRANGCMRVVPGSHRLGQLAHADSFADDNMLSRGQEVQVAVDEAEAVDIVLAPGEMSLHHVRLVHGSEPNRSDGPRVGFAVRYIPTRCRQLGGRTTAILARGVDRFGHFDPAPRPDAPLSPVAWANHAEAMRRMNAVLFQGAAQETRVAGHRVVEG